MTAGDHTALALDCAYYSDLAEVDGWITVALAPSWHREARHCGSSSPMAILVFSADVGFINFDLTSQREGVATHRGAPTMADIPRGTPVSARPLAEDDAPDL